MWRPSARRALLLASVGAMIVSGCRSTIGPKPIETGKIRCEAPGPEAGRVFAARGSFKSILSVVQGSAGVETKWQRIRAVSPKGADFDIIAWRLCEAYSNGLIPKEVYAQMVAGATAGALDPQQLGKKFVLTGDVFEEGNTSKRIGGATVELNLVPVRYTTTDSKGVFRFVVRGLDEGKAPTVRVDKEGYEPRTLSKVALSESTGAVQVALKPEVKWFPLKGRVFDAERDKGLEGAQVILETSPRQIVSSQSEGFFLLKPLKGDINKDLNLRVKKRGYRDHAQMVRLAIDSPPLEVRLQPEVFVFQAKVVDPQGQEIDGAMVTLRTDPASLRDRSKSNGGVLFRVPARFEDRFVGVRVDKEGYERFDETIQLKREKKPELILKPLSGMGEYKKGLEAFQEGDYPKAVEHFARAAQINKTLTVAYYGLGQAQAKLNDWGAAERSFRKATALEGRRFEFQLELAKALVRLNRFQSAMLRFERAAELQPNNAEIYLQWARGLAADKQFGAAVDKYKRAIALSPNRYEPYEEASRILYELGRERGDSALAEEAVKLGRKAILLKEGKPLPAR